MNTTTTQHIFPQHPPVKNEDPLEIPNQETVASLVEAEQIAINPSVKGYRNLDELFTDLED